MFKKTEESEWSRFSRALSGQPKGGTEEIPTKEPATEPAPMIREPAPVAPPAPSAPARPAATAQTYPRPRVEAQHDADEIETLIGPRSTFEGTLNCESSMRIKGTAQGEIHCARSIVIEESAQVNAKVTAANAVVAGKVDGSIVCEGRLEVLATGRVTGELTAGVLIIQEGAFFEGHLKMRERRPDEPAAEPVRRFGAPEGA